MKKIFLFLMLAVVFVFGGCNNTKLISISIDGPETIECGKTYEYKAIFNPVDYLNQNVIWSCSDETKLIIDENTGIATPIDITDKNGIYIYATSKEEQYVKGTKKIYIYEEGPNPPKIDLNGYTIKIANSEKWIIRNDPFSETYQGIRKADKQKAWEEIEKLYNCNIEYVSYPDTGWGYSFLWSNLKIQALNGTISYDFITIPYKQIYEFLEDEALTSLQDYYIYHGKNLMSDINIKEGTFQNELYTFTAEKNNIYNVMYYNIGLFETLQQHNPNLIEPAQMFLDGNWTHSNFLQFCKEIQNTMSSLYGEKGTPGNEKQEYFALSGWDAYYWVGLATNDGEAIVDVKNKILNLTTSHKESAANIVKEIYNNGYASSRQAIDQNVEEWIEGKALFNTGDLWFVNDDSRWSSNLWGEDTRYGYVPWPRADDIKFDDIQIALSGTDNPIVMPVGRDYNGYGEDCTSENIYKIVVELYSELIGIEKYYESLDSSTYPHNANMYAESTASMLAYLYIQKLINDGKYYYDPMVVNASSINGSLQLYSNNFNTIKGALSRYISGSHESWNEAVGSSGINETLLQAMNRK